MDSTILPLALQDRESPLTFDKEMKRLSGYYRPIRKVTEEQIQKWSGELIALIKKTIEQEATRVDKYVDHLRELNPDIPREKLARKIINRRSLKAGAIGTVLNLGGLITMPVTMPTDMYWTFRIQARMVLALALLYDWDVHDEDTQTDILLVMGGNAGINAVKSMGVKIGQEWGKKAVQQHITRETMKKINSVVSRKIITKAGEKSATSFLKLVPLIGGPIGGAFDLVGTQMVGRTALKFYQG